MVSDWSGMSDLINRQDAINAIQKRADEVDSVYSAFWEGLKSLKILLRKFHPQNRNGRKESGILLETIC